MKLFAIGLILVAVTVACALNSDEDEFDSDIGGRFFH